MLKKYGDDSIKDVVIKGVNQTTETTNEFLSTVDQKVTPETGYDKFNISHFRGLETRIEESVVQRVSQKLTRVKNFKVAKMILLPLEVRCQFFDFAANVIEQH